MKPFKICLAVLAVVVAGVAQAEDPKATIDQLDARLAKLGAVKREGSFKAGDRQAPGIYFGTRRINNNYDLVDDIRKSVGATATVFVRDGEEFVRVSTNVLTPEGKRGIGTTLAHAKAYEAVRKGEPFCGQVDVLGTLFDACYHAIKDPAGAVIGATYVGFKK